jgi:hypothetical protein
MNEKLMSEIMRYSGRDVDVIYQPFYDTFTFQEGPFVHEFNCVPLGIKGKTNEDTNVLVANEIGLGRDFYITGIGVYFVPNSDCGPEYQNTLRNISDTLFILSHGYLRFIVGLRQYLELAPLAALPPQFPMYWARDNKSLERLLSEMPTKAEGEGIKKQKPFEMVPIYIKNDSFAVSISMKNVFRLNNPGKIGVMLDGYLVRHSI